AQPEPPIVEYVFHSEDYWNVIQFHRPEVDELVTLGRSTPDQETRAEGYRQLQQIFYDEAIQCQQFWVQQAHVLRADLEGVVTTSRGGLLYPHLWRFN